MQKFDVEVKRTIYKRVFVEAETPEEAEKIAKELATQNNDLNTWWSAPTEFRFLVTILLANDTRRGAPLKPGSLPLLLFPKTAEAARFTPPLICDPRSRRDLYAQVRRSWPLIPQSSFGLNRADHSV
jgi:hypothetical protein